MQKAKKQDYILFIPHSVLPPLSPTSPYPRSQTPFEKNETPKEKILPPFYFRESAFRFLFCPVMDFQAGKWFGFTSFEKQHYGMKFRRYLLWDCSQCKHAFVFTTSEFAMSRVKVIIGTGKIFNRAIVFATGCFLNFIFQSFRLFGPFLFLHTEFHRGHSAKTAEITAHIRDVFKAELLCHALNR